MKLWYENLYLIISTKISQKFQEYCDIYDKRDDFPFSIVRMPYMDSNIPQTIFYSALVGEFLRIARSTLLYEDFENKAMSLCQRMQSQGANSVRMKRSLHKIVVRHPNDFARFRTSPKSLIKQVLRD